MERSFETYVQMPLHLHRLQAYERSQRTARTPACHSSLAFAFAFRLLFPYGLSTMRVLCVHKPLADNSLHRNRGALYIVYAKPHAIGIAEVEFCQVAVQMLLRAMLVDALMLRLKIE